MPKTTIPSDTYTDFLKDFKLVKSLNLTGFIKWVRSIHESGYYDGWCECIDRMKDARGKVNLDDEIELMVLEVDDLRETMLSVKGIGVRRVEEVIEKLTGDSVGTE